MGSGGAQTHTLYETAPTISEIIDDPDPLVSMDPDLDAAQDELPLEGTTHETNHDPLLEDFHAVLDEIHALSAGPEALAAGKPEDVDEDLYWYARLTSLSAEATQKLSAATFNGLSEEDGNALDKLKGQATRAALASLDRGQLEKIAADQGFVFPELVGLNHDSGQPHALAHWLDPHYLSELESKKKIQAKAKERFLTLCAGGTVPGRTLADVDHRQYQLSGSTTWSITQDQFDALHQGFVQRADAYQHLQVGDRPAALAELVDMENKLVSAHISTYNADTAQNTIKKAEATGLFDKAVTGAAGGWLGGLYRPTIDQAIATGALSEEQAQVLPSSSAFMLARDSTSDDHRSTLITLAEERATQLQTLSAAKDKLLGADGITGFTDSGALITAKSQLSSSEITDLVSAMKDFSLARKDVSSWCYTVHGSQEITNGVMNTSHTGHNLQPYELEKSFKKWAATQDKYALQGAAHALGMPDALNSTKTQVKKFLPTVWTEPIAAKAKAGWKPPVAKAKTATPPSASTASTSAPPTSSTGFMGKHAALVAALQHHGAAAAEVPKPIDAALVASHDFGTGTSAASLGGSHSKSLHTGPDGKPWLFKPDKQTNGARAHAEKDAYQVFRVAGIPAVPVYTATIGSYHGVVQPMLQGATPLNPDAGSWSQADVDSLVRTHVTRWAIGDHDGHPDNLLRTNSGGLLPIDAGQAFKYFGRDKLSLDYQPSAGAGFPPPAHHTAYRAFMKGKLASGVKIRPEVAHPVIKKLESIPDSQWRTLLHSTAHEGAKNPAVAWVPTMRERAAAKHGISVNKVNHKQIAEAFLDHACERKKSLRADFVNFFKKELNLAAEADLLKHGE